MTDHEFRIHPAIGIARVGNSDEYYLGPETMAASRTPGSTVRGGLPIRAGTEDEPITSSDLRDQGGALKRQAARFRVFAYPAGADETYPRGDGVEVRIGDTIGGRVVRDLVWTVHLANKKANSYVLNDDLGIRLYEPANAERMTLRNSIEGNDPNSAARIRKMVIDAGPRAIRGTDCEGVQFDVDTVACAADGADITAYPAYPKSFPGDNFDHLYTPTGTIDSLGSLETDEHGRLLVIAASGRACGWARPDGTPYPLVNGLISPGVYGDVNADGWMDDTGDGPVSVTIVFEDGPPVEAHGAWVVCTDPSYAPQSLNVVSLWDDVYDTWVRELGLVPAIFDHRFASTFQPTFDDQIHPIFLAASMQRWTTNLPARAVQAHDALARITGTDRPVDTIMGGLAFVRDPNDAGQHAVGAPFMPLSMGDAGKSFLTVTKTQYFFLSQWNDGSFTDGIGPELGPGEHLDKAVLVNCLGGRFAPGIELTFVVREPDLYETDWRRSGGGPFRIRRRRLRYDEAQASQPFLTVGYVPRHPGPDGVRPAPLEPGDASKFMAVPWHTDYNSCATHEPAPNPTLSSTLYWSWPAQRPVQIYRAEDVHDGTLGRQDYSMRGTGTYSEDLGSVGRYQELIDIVRNWHKIGIVMQGSQIDGGPPDAEELFLETESQLDVVIEPWPMNATKLGG